jgi:hypothetical protein
MRPVGQRSIRFVRLIPELSMMAKDTPLPGENWAAGRIRPAAPPLSLYVPEQQKATRCYRPADEPGHWADLAAEFPHPEKNDLLVSAFRSAAPPPVRGPRGRTAAGGQRGHPVQVATPRQLLTRMANPVDCRPIR